MINKEFGLKTICFSKEICKVRINENKIIDFKVKIIQL